MDLSKDILLTDDLDLDFSRPTNKFENVKQHIITRLLVQKGEEVLTPNFGSRLFELNDVESIVNEVVNVLNEEPRIQELGSYVVKIDGRKLILEFENVIGRVEISF